MRVTVTTSPASRPASILRSSRRSLCAPVTLLAENFGAARAAELVKLGVERLPIGADAGIADTAVLWVSFSHILREAC